jgi:hypothetical protein
MEFGLNVFDLGPAKFIPLKKIENDLEKVYGRNSGKYLLY